MDHVVLAAPDLDVAKADFFRATGVEPVDGGPHPGGGTHNALVSFGGGCYLEIIAPDPQQNLAGTNGARMAKLTETTLLHWALRSTDLERVSSELLAAGFEPGAIRDMARQSPDGETLRWRLMGMVNHTLGGLAPFFIDWRDTPHPANAAPVVGELDELALGLPTQAAALGAMLSPLVAPLAEPGLSVQFDSPRGVQVLKAGQPKGFSF